MFMLQMMLVVNVTHMQSAKRENVIVKKVMLEMGKLARKVRSLPYFKNILF